MKAAKVWIIDHVGEVHSVGASLLQSAREGVTFDRRLYVLYVANDVLFHFLREGGKFAGARQALEAYIAPLVAAVVQVAGPVDLKKVQRVVDLWREKECVSSGCLGPVDSQLSVAASSRGPAPPVAPPPVSFPPQGGPGGAPPGGFSGMSGPGIVTPGVAAGGLVHHQSAQQAVPGMARVGSLLPPPGVIADTIRASTAAPYTPLDLDKLAHPYVDAARVRFVMENLYDSLQQKGLLRA